MDRYRVRVTKDYLVFCSAHFIVFDNDRCERLHGHNYRVAAEIEDDLNEDHLVFDFIALKEILRGITAELDHRMLVPMKSSRFQIEAAEHAVRIRYREKEWVFPLGDCILLAVENTTAELLARWIAGRLGDEIRRRYGKTPRILRVEVEESPGQSALYEAGAPVS
jgi:6-pyruvoyltetrahydropterin/6-carboxytetrahydropterin synthase